MIVNYPPTAPPQDRFTPFVVGKPEGRCPPEVVRSAKTRSLGTAPRLAHRCPPGRRLLGARAEHDVGDRVPPSGIGAAEPDPEEPAHGAASAVAPDQIARPQHLGSVNRDSLVVLLEAGQPPVPAQLAAEFGKAALQDLLDARLQDSHLIRVPGVECGVVQGDTREVASFDPADRLLVRVRQQPAQREQLGGGRLQALQEPLKSACDCSAAAGRAEATPSARFAPAAVRS